MREKRCNSSIVREFDQQLLLDALSRFSNGEIAIVWDRLLVRQLGMLVSPRLLLEKHNVTQNLSLDKVVVVGSNIVHIVYLVAPLTSSVDILIQNFPQQQANDMFKGFHIFFVPEANYILIERLKVAEAVWRRVGRAVSSIACHWFPNDQPNFLHMGLPQLPTRMLIDGDWNFLYKCAVALHQLKRNLIGSGRNLTIYCKGEWSIRIVEILKRLDNRDDDEDNGLSRSAIDSEIPSTSSSLLDIDTIVMMDRWLDILTPMLTQFTFAGAIDELFGIDVQGKMGNMPLDDLQKSSELTSLKDTSFILHGEVHNQLQDLHLNAVAGQIKQILKELHEEEQMLKSLSTISDLKNCVGRIQEILAKRKWTENFLRIAEVIQRKYSDDFFVEVVNCEQSLLIQAKNSNGGGGDKINMFIENAIIDARPPSTILRLIAIQSLAALKGLRPQVAHAYRKLFVQSYGIFSLRWWLKLQLAGVIREEPLSSLSAADRRFEIRCSSTNYTQNVKKLRIFHEEVTETNAAYVYNGRTSLLIRYLEEAFQNNWVDFIKIENFFSGNIQHYDPTNASLIENLVSKSPTDGLASSLAFTLGINASKTKKKKKPSEKNKFFPKTILFVVGGLTRAEISAIRKFHADKICLCASTAVITADSFLRSFQ